MQCLLMKLISINLPSLALLQNRASPHLFQLDERTRKPTAVAGVPPDYFSADGQLWGSADRGDTWERYRLEGDPLTELHALVRAG